MRPRITVLYHYYSPDDVVSARHFDGLCQGLAQRGWDVTVLPCNRGCRDERRSYPCREERNGVHVRRIWRPRLQQASTLGRIVNAAWMLAAWSTRALPGRGRRPDVLLVGTDPMASVLVARLWRLLRPDVRLAHWCFDMYPEALVAAGMLPARSWTNRLLRRLVGAAYRCCDLVAELGPCMRQRLLQYGERPTVTLVPWALVEPESLAAPDPAVRQAMFGDARLGLLYSGNFGQAHTHREILDLARSVRGTSIRLAFAVRGNRVQQLRDDVGPADDNIRFLDFVPERDLPAHLGAADVHLASLQPEWAGIAVPSKFFGSLAIGRPVLFAGAADCAIAGWVRQHGVGWVLTADNRAAVADELRRLSDRPDELAALQQRCHAVYHEHFAREKMLDRWDEELRRLLEPRLAQFPVGRPSQAVAPRGPRQAVLS